MTMLAMFQETRAGKHEGKPGVPNEATDRVVGKDLGYVGWEVSNMLETDGQGAKRFATEM